MRNSQYQQYDICIVFLFNLEAFFFCREENEAASEEAQMRYRDSTHLSFRQLVNL